MKITEALLAEHKMLCGLFDQVERVVPQFGTVKEVAAMALLLQGMLERHASTEAELGFLALDHVLAENGQLERMYHDHQEIDNQFQAIATATDVREAKQLISAAMAYSRSHFKTEERSVFPFLEQTVPLTALNDLGKAWLQASPALISKE